MNWFPFTYILANLITNSIHAWLTKDYVIRFALVSGALIRMNRVCCLPPWQTVQRKCPSWWSSVQQPVCLQPTRTWQPIQTDSQETHPTNTPTCLHTAAEQANSSYYIWVASVLATILFVLIDVSQTQIGII